jgi:hypothetical protein
MPELLKQADFLNLPINDLRLLAASGQSKKFQFILFLFILLFRY